MDVSTLAKQTLKWKAKEPWTTYCIFCRNAGILCLIGVANLMDLPPLFLIDDLCAYEYREIYYPAPLLELWMRSAQPPISLLSYERQLNKFIFSVCTGRTSIALHPEPARANWICKSLQFNQFVPRRNTEVYLIEFGESFQCWVSVTGCFFSSVRYFPSLLDRYF